MGPGFGGSEGAEVMSDTARAARAWETMSCVCPQAATAQQV